MEEQNQNQSSQPQPQPKTEEGQKINVIALISYLGPLCLIPILTQEKNEFVKFHAKQGLILFISEAIIWFFVALLPIFYIILWIFNIAWLVLSIIGIINVTKNKKKELPLIGKFAENLKF
ncbi:DUF4870 domain-containing protein [Patescibacteria group bacterium]